MKRGLGILFAGVLSVSAIQYSRAGQSDIPPRTSVRSTSDSSTASPQSAANASRPVLAECPDFRYQLLQVMREFSDVAQPVRQQFLITTLPDPVHTHLSLFFDRSIEMIEEAAQTEGYIFDRSLLPWDNKSHPEQPDFRIRDKENACTELRENNPGVLIFRPSKEEDGALFVFVVGEKPTGGINYPQFHEALEMIHEKNAGAPLRILGPTFSGSLYSLDKILRKAGEPVPENIYIRSGTVTSWPASNEFMKAWCGDRSPPGRKVQFATFQESDRYRLRHLLHDYINKRGYSSDEVAQLSEAETAFGSFSTGKKAPDHCPDVPNLSEGAEEAQVLHLYFPREISQLRSAYQHDIYMDQSTGNTSTKSTPRSTLKLDFDNVGADDDSVPGFSGKQLPLSQESILLGIVTSLKKHHSRFVVLRATDPLDELFLSRFLRQAYPDGRVITLGADLLYNRQEDTLLHGVWAMSTYPLITDMHRMLPELGEADHETIPHVDRNFPFSYGVGTYNATLSLLAGGGELKPKGEKCPASDLCVPEALYEQYGWPSIGGDVAEERLRTPPLWLSVMGRDGYWPMALLDDAKSAKPNDPPSRLHEVEGKITAQTFELSSPASWSVLCGICLVLAMTHLLLVWNGSSMSHSEAFAQFAPHKNWRRIALLFLAGIATLSVLEILINLETSLLRGSILVVGTLIFTTGFLLDLKRRSRKSPQQKTSPDRELPVAVMLGTPIWHFIWVLVVTAIIVTWGILARSHQGSWRIFLYRSVHIASTVSPIIPVLLLIAAVYWCVWHCLSGASLLDRRRPRLPDVAHNTGSSQATGITPFLSGEFECMSFGDMKDLRKVAKPFTFDARIAVPMVVLGAIASVMFNFKHPVESLEGRTYDYVYSALLFLIAGLLLSNLFRLLAIWLECRHLLLALDRLPLRRAFRKLHGFSWKPIWRPGGSAFRDSLRMIAREIECLSHLKSALEKNLNSETKSSLFNPERREQHETVINAISAVQDNDYRKLWRALQRREEASFRWKSLIHRWGRKALMIREPALTARMVERFKALQQKLANVCGMTLNFLHEQWPGEDGPIANHRQEKPAKYVELAEEYVALVYSSFIMNVLLRIRTIIMCVSGMFILILFSINSYPFQPQSVFRVLVVGLFLLIGCVVGSVYAQMHRDPTLSLLTDTKPGKLGIDFWIKLAAFGALPLVSLIASQFPGVNSFLFSWLQPALEALK